MNECQCKCMTIQCCLENFNHKDEKKHDLLIAQVKHCSYFRSKDFFLVDGDIIFQPRREKN